MATLGERSGDRHRAQQGGSEDVLKRSQLSQPRIAQVVHEISYQDDDCQYRGGGRRAAAQQVWIARPSASAVS